jgi:hypothetical protein
MSQQILHLRSPGRADEVAAIVGNRAALEALHTAYAHDSGRDQYQQRRKSWRLSTSLAQVARSMRNLRGNRFHSVRPPAACRVRSARGRGEMLSCMG